MTSQPAQPTRFPRWLRLTIGVAALLAVLILVFAVVKGLRDGTQQLETQRRQQIAILSQQAVDFQSDGDSPAALEAYRQILLLDPENASALDGIGTLLSVDSASMPVVPVAPVAVAPTPSSPQTPLNPMNVVWADAQSLAQEGRWAEAIDRLLQVQAKQTQLKTEDPTFDPQQLQDQLYTAYASLGMEKSNAGSLEEAVSLFDRALEIRPDEVQIRTVRDVTAQYVDALTYWFADWPKAIDLLTLIYEGNPSYRDVRQKLQEAHLEYGDSLAKEGNWCEAADQYAQAIVVQNALGLGEKQTEFQILCDSGAGIEATEEGTPMPGEEGTPAAGSSAVAASGTGRILYSAVDATDGRSRIFAQPVTANVRPVLLVEDASEPNLQRAGRRIAFRSTRGDLGGLGGSDPGTDLRIRFSTFTEDSLPSWNPAGDRIVFASNREGDRRWRVYITWADGKGVADVLDFGNTPSWHPTQDRIVYQGCDPTGNGCGLWTLTSAATSRTSLTSQPGDTRPTWSPDGTYVLFMSRDRHGNWEIYRLTVATGEVLRLTTNNSNDVLPTVSPDGTQIAFLSDRDGSWKIWLLPIAGGIPRALAPITGTLSPDWSLHSIQWVR